MIRFPSIAALVATIAVASLAGCGQSAPRPEESEAAAAADSTPVPVVPAPSPTPTPDVSAPGVPSASRDPAEVLAAWSTAVQIRDWATVRAYWGDKGARSGLDERAFAAKWSNLLDPRVTVGKGEGEGAAGSIFYTAPVTITDGARVLKGEIVLRRVNDVPGATDEQLRWHIESSTLAP